MRRKEVRKEYDLCSRLSISCKWWSEWFGLNSQCKKRTRREWSRAEGTKRLQLLSSLPVLSFELLLRHLKLKLSLKLDGHRITQKLSLVHWELIYLRADLWCFHVSCPLRVLGINIFSEEKLLLGWRTFFVWPMELELIRITRKSFHMLFSGSSSSEQHIQEIK